MYCCRHLPKEKKEKIIKNLDEIIKAKGYTNKNWITKEFDSSEHSIDSWTKALPMALEFLLKK